MINCIAYDVEVLRNFFSITFVSINSYLKVFKDCVNADGKAIPLVQKLSVEEIKARLETVEKYKFYITDKDDSQLLPIIGYINKTRCYKDSNGTIIRTDLYGFNNFNYDNLMIAALLSFYMRTNSTKELINKLYETSKTIISSQDDKDKFRTDFYLNSLRKYKLPFTGIDVMRIFALNKASVVVDSKTGERKPVPKGLKQTSINLQWYELLEYELPDINEKEAELYDEIPSLKGMSISQLNKLVDKWDRFILDKYIEPMMHYNLNDVFIVAEIVRLYPEEIKSRYAISKAYDVDVLNSSRSKTADILFEKFYSKFSGLAPEQWKGKKTERTAMSFKKVIFPFIKFKTKPMQDFLDECLKTTIYRVNKDAFSKEVKIGNVTYTVATGGLHSQDNPVELWSSGRELFPSSTGGQHDILNDDDYVYIHADINSMYPSIIAAHKVAPAHLDTNAFCNLIGWLKNKRVEVKHSDEDTVDGIDRDTLALVLKIVINSVYGKLGFENGNLYDRLAVLKTTINGQLMMLMLVEELELHNIHVLSANTDGIVIKLYKRDIDTYNSIKDVWEQTTKLKFDTDYYHCLVSRDINNYLSQFRVIKNGVHKLKLESKGALNPMMYSLDLTKGYSMPIVAQAIENYFLKNKPVMDTLQEATNILDFCLTQNVGKQFHVEETKIENGQVAHVVCQRYVRFYVSNRGYIIEKVHNDNGSRSRMAAGSVVTVINSLDDKDISLRDINFKFYYQEAMKIINPIKLKISPKGKGKSKIKKYSGMYNPIFNEDDFG